MSLVLLTQDDCKSNIQVIYMLTKLAVNGILKEFLRKEARN
jgi:hypothetical protein